MQLIETDWSDLFILQAPEYRTKRQATRKPREAVLKRLRKISTIQMVEVHEILQRQKRDFISPRREKWRRQMRQQEHDEDSRRIRHPLVWA